jgi:O-glycosyl hydrolase
MNYWTNADRILNDLKSMGNTQVVDGVAFHHYNPLASTKNMSKLHDLHPEFYLLSQFSKFIRPGVVRIDCNIGSEKTLTSVVFRNTDNSMVQVTVNQTSKEQPFITVIGDHCFDDKLAPGSVGTYLWNSRLTNSHN